MRVRTTVLALSFFGVMALAGCFGGTPDDDDLPPIPAPTQVELTNATFGFGRFFAAKVPALDGIELHIDVTLPDGEGPFPTILDYTPYYALGGAAGPIQKEHPEVFGEGVASFYNARGYATATAHVRGTGESGGCLTIGHPVEGQDGYALVEWIAAQPWSTGKVAMMGTSYVGTTPLETAVWQPPHLTTIIPISPVTEWYLYYFENGLHRHHADPPPGASTTDAFLWAGIGIVPGPRTLANGGADDVLCQAEFFQQDMVNDDYNAYWQERDHHARAGNITVPVLFAHGWGDGNVAATGIETLWENITAEKRLWIQQHGHGVPGSKTGWHEYVHRWLDHHLLGRDNGAMLLPEVVIEDNLARFRTEPAWPPLDQSWQRLDLSAGTLGGDPGGTQRQSILDTGAPGQTDDVDRLSYTSARFEEATHIAGTLRLHLRIGADLPRAQVAVNLFDDAPDGGASLLVSRGFLDLRHRDSLESGKDLTPGLMYDVTWELHPNDHVVVAGHSLRLVIAANDVYVRPSMVHGNLLLDVGGGASWLELPVVPDETRTFLEKPPTPWEPAGGTA